jgi:hypothetical protein
MLMAIREILDLIDDKGLNDNEFKSLLKKLDEEISGLKPRDKSIVVGKTENTTIRMEVKDGKRRIVKTKTLQPPLNVSIEFEGPHTSLSVIRKYVTRENIETLLSSETI